VIPRYLLFWLILAIVAVHSGSRLPADYNLFAGRVWSLFLARITVVPYVTWRLANA
jgi:hypothetical protein